MLGTRVKILDHIYLEIRYKGKSRYLINTLVLFFCSNTVLSQFSDRSLYEERKNLLKVNLSSLVFDSYQFQVERVLIKPISVGLTYIHVSDADVPFAEDTSLFLFDNSEFFEDEDIFLNMITTASISGYSIVSEIRFYLGKGFGKGFYLAPFYKFSNYDLNNVEIVEFNRDDESVDNLITSGNIKSNSFGLLIGAQFNLGQRFILDFFLGPHIGRYSGRLRELFEEQLSLNEQFELNSQLETFQLPLDSDASIEISSEIVNINSSGNWLGIRAGIGLGMRF